MQLAFHLYRSLNRKYFIGLHTLFAGFYIYNSIALNTADCTTSIGESICGVKNCSEKGLEAWGCQIRFQLLYNEELDEIRQINLNCDLTVGCDCSTDKGNPILWNKSILIFAYASVDEGCEEKINAQYDTYLEDFPAFSNIQNFLEHHERNIFCQRRTPSDISSAQNNTERTLQPAPFQSEEKWKWPVIAMAILIVGLALLSVYLTRRKSSDLNPIFKLTQEEINQFKDGFTPDESALPYGHTVAFTKSFDEKYEIERSRLKFDTTNLNSQLGAGEFGIVYKGRLKGIGDYFQTVAIKTFNPNSVDKSALTSLLNEIKVHAFVGSECPYIITFLGACTQNIKNGEVYSVLEFCALGSLLDYLQEKEENKSAFKLLDDVVVCARTGYSDFNQISTPVIQENLFENLVKWSRQIAVAMDFLSLKKVLHIDLAARNVLLTEDMIAKVSDFGLSSKLYGNVDYEKSSLKSTPFKWIALESLLEYKYSVKSDVWAYAVTLWEMFSLGKQPYGSMGWTELLCFLQSGRRLTQPLHATQEIYDQMLKCWDKDPDGRPSFSEFIEFFEHSENTDSPVSCRL